MAIYQWVRNNIEFIPSYGSIQGSEYTLENRRGSNAFDTASLLIALSLRTPSYRRATPWAPWKYPRTR